MPVPKKKRSLIEQSIEQLIADGILVEQGLSEWQKNRLKEIAGQSTDLLFQVYIISIQNDDVDTADYIIKAYGDKFSEGQKLVAAQAVLQRLLATGGYTGEDAKKH